MQLSLTVARKLLARVGVLGRVREVVKRVAVAAGQVDGWEQLSVNVRALGLYAVAPHIVATAVPADQVESCSCHDAGLSEAG